MGTGKTYSTKYLLDSNNSSGVAGQVLSTTSTGIDWVNANTVPGTGLWLANGNDIYNSNSGNVGIGVTNPTAKITLADHTTPAGGIKFRTAATSVSLYAVGSGTLGTTGSFNVGSRLRIPGGNAVADPDIHFTGATAGTGFSRAGQDITFVAGGSEKMRLLAGGNFGIGTTNPFTNLEIEGSGLDSIIRLYTATGAANIRTWEMRAVGVAGEGLLFRQVNDANTVYTNRMILDTSGNVGIGTTSPDALLDLESTTPALRITDTDNNKPYELRVDGETFSIKEVSNSRTLMSMTTGAVITLDSLGSNTVINTTGAMIVPNGIVGIGTTAPAVKFQVHRSDDTVTQAGITNSGAGAVALYFDASNGDMAGGDYMQMGQNNDLSGQIQMEPNAGAFNIKTGTSSPTRFTVLQNGNVGIGTTSPNEKLDVNGAVVISPNTDGKETFRFTTGAVDDARLFMKSDTTVKVDIQANGISYFNGGNVGISTSNPRTKLHVESLGSGSSFGSCVYLHGDTATNFPVMRIDNATGGNSTDTHGLLINNTAAGAGLRINNGSSMALIVNASGNVGIGETSPTSKLSIKGADAAIDITRGNAGDSKWEFSSDSTAMYISEMSTGTRDYIMTLKETTGNVGIGTTSPDANLEVVGTTVTSTVSDGVNAVLIGLAGSNRTTVQFDTADTTHTNRQWGLTNIAGDFYVGRHGLNVMTMLNNGDVGIGTSSPDVKFHVTQNEDGSGLGKGTAKFINTNTGQGATTMHMVQASSSNFANAVKFWQGLTPTAVGFIRLTTSSTLFITSASDLNLKKNITTWSDDTLSKFKALEPKKFRFKTQDVSEDKTLGFIAQNEVDNFPEAYPQFLGEDEKPYYGFNPTGMVPHLMKAIKDLVEKVEILENKITQLENNN